MTQDIASLGIGIDTRQVKKGEADLDQLTAAGDRADKSAARLGASWAKAGQAIAADTGRIVQQLQSMAAAQQRQEQLLAGLNSTLQAVERGVQALAAAQMAATRAAQGHTQATEQETAAAIALARAQARAAEAQARIEVETQKAARAASLAAAAQSKLETETQKSAAAADKLARDQLKVEEAQRKAADAAAKQTQEAEKQNRALSMLATAAAGVGAAMVAALVVRRVTDMTMALYEASAAGERLRTTLDFATGGMGGKELAYVTKMANDLGLQLSSTAKAYASFAAAAKGTVLEGQATRDTFEAVSKAAAVMGLTADQSAGALLALQQMVSKGTVQAEELRGQLGERLPGAFQIAAKAMGVTTAELGKMLEQGQVATADFLPKFAAALNAHVGDAAEKAANRLDASINRMDNAWERFKRNVGDAGVSQATQGQINILTDAFDSVSESMEGAKRAGDGFTGQMVAGAGAALRWLNPINAFSYETQSLAGKLSEAEQEVKKLTDRATVLKNGIANGLYGPSMQRDLDETNRKLADARNRFREVDAAMRNLSGTGAGAGRGMVNRATVAQMEAEAQAVAAGVKAYTENSERMTKAQRQAKEVSDANAAADKLLGDARLTAAQRTAILTARTTELANINEKYRDKSAGATAARQERAETALIASIEKKIAQQRIDLEQVGKITDAQKIRIDLEQQEKDGKIAMTAAEKADALAKLATLQVLEQQIPKREILARLDAERLERDEALRKAQDEQMAAAAAGDRQISERLRLSREAQEFVELEIRTLGQTASARAVANEQLRIEHERRQAIAAINANTGYGPEERASRTATVNNDADAAKDRAKTISDMRELNELLDPDRAESFGEALAGAFEGALNPLVKAGKAIESYAKSQAVIEKGRKTANREIKDETELRKALAALDQEEGRNRLNMFATLADASSAYFDKESKGHKALQAVNQAIRAAEMAGSLASLATTGSVETAKQSMYSITALAAALAGPWPANIVAFAQVAGMLAGIGVAVSGGGGGGGGDTGYGGIKAGGTGTTLGAEGDPSKSISNAIEMLADNSRIELTVSQRMLAELTKVREGIAGLAGDVSKDFFIRGMAGGSFGDDFLDSGVGFLPGQTVGDIINNGIEGFGFNLIFQKGAQAMWRELDPAFKRSISSVLGSIVDTVVSAADMLGLADGGLIDRMLSIIPTLGDTSTYALNGIFQQGGGLLSFKDKSGKEIQEELEAVFSSVGDQMVAQALPALAAYQRVGEGMFETLIRVTNGIERAEYALELFGIAAIDYTEVVRKSGDVATEIVRQSVMALEPVGSGVAQIIDAFTGEFEDLLDTYQQLMQIRGLLRDIGSDDMALGTGQVRGAGGIDALASGIESFRDAFFSEQEQVDAAWARMAEQFERLNQVMPTTNQGFRDLVLGVDQSTEEGRQLFGALVVLAEQFADVTDRTDALAKGAADAAQALQEAAQAAAEAAVQARRDAADAALQSAQSAYALLQRSVTAQKAELKKEYDAAVAAARAAAQAAAKRRAEQNRLAQEAANTTLSALRTIMSAIEGAMRGAVIESEELTRQRRMAALALVQSAAGGSGSLAGVAGLNEALQTLQGDSQSLYATFEEYARDQALAAVALEDLKTRGAAQVSTQELILKALQDSASSAAQASTVVTDALTAQYEADLAALDEQLAMGQQHLDVLGGIDKSVISVADAVERTRLAIIAAYEAQLRVDAQTSNALIALYARTFPDGRDTVDGSHAMGLASVPFDGYVARLHAGERVLTERDNEIFSSGDWLRGAGGDNGETAALLRELLAEQRRHNATNERQGATTERNTGITAQVVQQQQLESQE